MKKKIRNIMILISILIFNIKFINTLKFATFSINYKFYDRISVAVTILYYNK